MLSFIHQTTTLLHPQTLHNVLTPGRWWAAQSRDVGTSMAVSRDAERKKLLSPEETKQMPPRLGQRWVMGPTEDWVGPGRTRGGDT